MPNLRIGIIGCGEWGKNHLRTFDSMNDCTVSHAADLSEKKLQSMKQRYSWLRTTAKSSEVIQAGNVDAIVIATTTRAHYGLAKQALEAGKHVLCEKPLTLSSQESQELTELAESKQLTLMVGHVFMFNPGIMYLKEQIKNGALGNILYMDSVRTNLGPIRQDVGAIYDLASHDISIFNFLLDEEPLQVSAKAGYYIQPDREDMAYVTLEYPNMTISHAHVSWLNPRKVRQLTVVGDKKMMVWDDIMPLETIRIYDKGLNGPPDYDTFGQFQISLRDADVTIPKVQMFEPLRKQAEHFVRCVQHRERPLSDGWNGLSVVRTLEAAMQSLREEGRTVSLFKNGYSGPENFKEQLPPLPHMAESLR